MAQPTVAILHPGEMGAAIGACARARGARVVWASEGRTPATRDRAGAAGLFDVGSLDETLGAADIVLSVCPPHGALDLARAVAARSFTGLYVDANAVSPATTREIGRTVASGGATFVDGGIIGPPPGPGAGTRLYLAGKEAARVAALFADTRVEAIAVDGDAGAASALKMCYAAWTKGSTALVAAIRALAACEGVEADLVAEWQHSQGDLAQRSEGVRTSARKAWRWIAEMEEIAATFAAAGLPAGFHEAAAEIYRRLEPCKDAPAPPPLGTIIHALPRP
jgi:3-hydroxyisobutyrate dehydrogenase-like beta-hydroxyacid dehydrogenase